MQIVVGFVGLIFVQLLLLPIIWIAREDARETHIRSCRTGNFLISPRALSVPPRMVASYRHSPKR